MAVPFCGDYCNQNAERVRDVCHELGKSGGSKILFTTGGMTCYCICPMTGTGLGRLWRRLRSGFSDRAPATVQRERLAACADCPNALARAAGGGVCALCGCAVRLKAMVASAACPAGRWQAV